MNDITILVTTFERPGILFNCLESIRHFYADIKITVVDNGKERGFVVKKVRNKYRCQYIKLPYDSGVSLCRNKGLDEIDTDYVVLAEDDFIFTENTKIEKFKTILDADSELVLIGGTPMTSGGKIGTIGSKIIINKERSYFWRKPIKNPGWQNADGIKYYYAEYTRQFFMMRNVAELRWDADMKIGGEHIDFFIQLKIKTDWKVGYTPSVIVKHDRERPSLNYKMFRRRPCFEKMLFDKKGFRYGIFNDHTIFDYKEGAKYKASNFEYFEDFKREIINTR